MPTTRSIDHGWCQGSGVRLGALVCACVLLFTQELPASCQEVGAAAVLASSGNPELPESAGGMVSVEISFRPRWSLAFSLERLFAETRKEGLVCRSYAPLIGCATEETRNEVQLTGFRAMAKRTLAESDFARAGGGMGLSFQELNTTSRGLDSGLAGDVYDPQGGQVGALGMLFGSVSPIPGLGLWVTGAVTAHWVNFTACSDNRYDPFCTSTTFYEFVLGVSYAFGRPEG